MLRTLSLSSLTYIHDKRSCYLLIKHIFCCSRKFAKRILSQTHTPSGETFPVAKRRTWLCSIQHQRGTTIRAPHQRQS